MRKLLLLIVVLLSLFVVKAQEQQIDSSKDYTKQDYLQLSKKQKRTANALLLTGLGVGLTGGLIYTAASLRDLGCLFQNCGANPSSYTLGNILMIGGSVLSLTSIPVYIKAGNNKKKSLSLSAGTQLLPRASGAVISKAVIPSLKLTMNF